MKQKQRFLHSLLLLAFCTSCSEPLANLTVPQREIIARYFSERDVRDCDVEIRNIRYYSNLKGVFGDIPGMGHEQVVLSYLDETASSADYPENGTPYFEPLQSVLRNDAVGKDFLQRAHLSLKNAGPHQLMVNISGWVVNGNISCNNPSKNRRFLLLNGYGQPLNSTD